MKRREFLKKSGLAVSAMGLLGCKQVVQNTGTTAEKGGMTRKGHNGTELGILGYGCMRWPMKDKVVDQEAVNKLVDHALANGINYFDTAPPYLKGMSETVTAKALIRHPRESYLLATKLSNFADSSREASMKMYEDSFKNLQTDYIDYYLLHAIGGGGIPKFENRFVNNGMVDFLKEERTKGKIRNLGFSFHGDKKCFDHLMGLHDEVHWDFVMIQLNYLDWRHAGHSNTDAEYLYTELEKRGIPVIVMEPLRGGMLSKLPQHIVEEMAEKKPGASAASWAFRFAGSHKNVITVLSGMTYMDHLVDNLNTYSPLEPLSEADFNFLEEVAKKVDAAPFIKCTACEYCMPCPYGIDIPGIFAHYNKCVNEGFVGLDAQDPEYRKSRRAYLISYDRAIPSIRQANHCIMCKQCVDHCPQKIKIHQEMFKISLYVDELKKNS